MFLGFWPHDVPLVTREMRKKYARFYLQAKAECLGEKQVTEREVDKYMVESDIGHIVSLIFVFKCYYDK